MNNVRRRSRSSKDILVIEYMSSQILCMPIETRDQIGSRGNEPLLKLLSVSITMVHHLDMPAHLQLA
jgi:hypothetical protein